MKNNLGILAAIAALMGASALNSNDLKPIDIDVRPKEKPIPKGCKRYFFNKDGECIKGLHTVYFDAMKRRTAYEKHQRWLKSQRMEVQ